ncbi:stalk domain-containing protein [Brevibacillus borstelensis]|uniref:stalk domain-containing protein n=1 Tax=Brevibacillus borstelensis TaxID=45462 RepID=UPI0030C3683F
MKKKTRSFLLALACLGMLNGLMPASEAGAASSTPSILLDGYPLAFPAEPRLVQGRTMVPFRAIAEALGIQVQWDPASRTITAVKDGRHIQMQLGNPQVVVNGTSSQLPVAPFEQNGHTLIPLQFFSTQFGAQVNWDPATRTVSIASPRVKMHATAFYAISSYSQRQYIPAFDAVAFGWARIDGNGQLTLQGKDFYWPKPAVDITPEKIIEATKEQGTAPSLMVFATDGTGELTRLLADSGLRERAIAEIASLAREKGFSGVSLDFEGLGLSGEIATARRQFTDFVQLLAKRLHESGISLSLVLHPLNSSYQGYDYASLGKLADELVLMAYAYEDEKRPEPLGKVNEAITMALAHVPKDKLLLGISAASENEQSIDGKIGLAKRHGLKGIALWRLGLVTEAEKARLAQSIEMKEAVPTFLP